MDISFIVINYRSRDYLRRCVESIFKYAKNFSFEVVIVNNDDAPLNGYSDLKNIRIIEHNLNFGFAQAANLGTKNAIGKILFFLNSDTEILDNNISEILGALSDLSVGAAAPKLILPNGSPQPWGAGYEITILDIVKNNFGFIKSSSIWTQDETSEIDWASGAALAISKEVFEKCNGFDEKFFMYFEDVDLCKRIRKTGKKIMLLPHIKIMHLGGQSKLGEKTQKKQYYESQNYYFKKHFGLFHCYLVKFLRNIALLFDK